VIPPRGEMEFRGAARIGDLQGMQVRRQHLLGFGHRKWDGFQPEGLLLQGVAARHDDAEGDIGLRPVRRSGRAVRKRVNFRHPTLRVRQDRACLQGMSFRAGNGGLSKFFHTLPPRL